MDEQKIKIEDKILDLKEDLSNLIKKNPLTAAALAAGIGFLLAKILGGKKD
ncbi:MAG: hypothetical protein K2P81_00905 [Bacteriovoracaceae bacterium]|nr:hypothetical protein [Bacteriovoracaceae bacterium]